MAIRTGLWIVLAHCASVTFAQSGPAALAECAASSSPSARAALVELYTSQGCSSCPPADRWLRRFALQPGAQVVPLSLHVKYWDHLGWKDPYARTEFTDRQRWLAARSGARGIYTPGVFINGREWLDWYASASQIDRLRQVVAGVPAADIGIMVDRDAGPKAVRVRVHAAMRQGPDRDVRATLFVALTESGLANDVSAGENRGERLAHDHVVRQWAGPFAPRADGTLHAELGVDTVDPARMAVVAFVQSPVTGEVFQALRFDPSVCLPRRARSGP